MFQNRGYTSNFFLEGFKQFFLSTFAVRVVCFVSAAAGGDSSDEGVDDSAAPEKADGAGAGGGGQGFVSDFELMLERKKEEKRKRRRRKDIDLINDNDDAIAKMIADMKLAAR